MFEQNKKKFQNGFTLQEMVIVIAIVTVISTGVYLIFANGRKLFNLQNYSAIAQNQALKTSLVMQREIREARSPEGMDLLSIEEANTQSIIFYADITEEAIDNRQEKLEYILRGNQIIRGISYWNSELQSYNPLPDLNNYVEGMAGASVICQYVVNGANPLFNYYDQDYTGNQSPMDYPINIGAIKIVRAHLEIDANPDRPPETYIQDTTIQLRNPNL
jgi:prepilin-type N-terminal cleavage/methylation domain-containing protein